MYLWISCHLCFSFSVEKQLAMKLQGLLLWNDRFKCCAFGARTLLGSSVSSVVTTWDLDFGPPQLSETCCQAWVRLPESVHSH